MITAADAADAMENAVRALSLTTKTELDTQAYRAFDRSEFETPYAWVRAEQDEEIRVVDVIRAAIPKASVYFHQGIVSVRASMGGASRDVVLVPGDVFTVTSTTVIRRNQA